MYRQTTVHRLGQRKSDRIEAQMTLVERARTRVCLYGMSACVDTTYIQIEFDFHCI